jgi:hypothetical protein
MIRRFTYIVELKPENPHHVSQKVIFRNGGHMLRQSTFNIAVLAGLLGAAPWAFADFIEIDEFGHGATIAVAWADCDNDGDPDLAVGNYQGQNQLFINNGDQSFTEVLSLGPGHGTFAVAWADYDNDGDPDLAVGNYQGQNQLFVNNGDCTFVEHGLFGTSRTIAIAWGDIDNDGDLDLAVGNGILGNAQQNQLFVNEGADSFTERDAFGVGNTDSLAWGDFDADGDLDLAVGNGGFGASEQNYLFINDGSGAFVERAEFGAGDTASVAWADADNDGDLDLAVGNWNNGQNMLYLNNGDGTFEAHEAFGARDTNTLVWGDVDNDGDLDLVVGNGDFGSADWNYLYVNDGTGTFTESLTLGQGSTDSVAWADFDLDGDLDLAVGNEHSPAQNRLCVNQEDTSSFVRVRLVGRPSLGPGYSNRDGIGAKVSVYEAGRLGEAEALLGFREIAAHGGFSSQSEPTVHFGVGDHETVDLRIVWPGSLGSSFVQEIRGVAAGRRVDVVENAPELHLPVSKDPPE